METAHVCTLETGSSLWVQISSLYFELVANAGEDRGSRQLVDGSMVEKILWDLRTWSLVAITNSMPCMMEQTALDKPKPTSAMGNVRADMTKMAGTPWPWTILWRASNGTINSFNKIKELCCISHLREYFVYVLNIICYRSLLQFVHTCFSYSCRKHEILFRGGLK